MKILFITTINPEKQGDYLELSLIHGFRNIIGDNFIDYPRKKILYGDFSETPKNSLHGLGFTYCNEPIKDIKIDRNNLDLKKIDVVLMGSGHMYGETWKIEHHNIWYTDGNDLYGNANRLISYNGEQIIGTQYTEKCFKRELVEDFKTVFPTGFGIPKNLLKPINLKIKNKLYQSTAPTESCFCNNSDYKFNNQSDYYYDMQQSWFGLSCKKGGWDCLRHYEIMACGALLLFKDFEKKPNLCEPNCPAISYSSKEELNYIINKMIINNKPTDEYLDMLKKQREWLLNYGTCEMRALEILKILNKYTNKNE